MHSGADGLAARPSAHDSLGTSRGQSQKIQAIRPSATAEATPDTGPRAGSPSTTACDRLVGELLAREPTIYERFVKPAFDRVVAAVLLAVLAPTMLLVYVALLVTLGRPVMFRQTRVGRHGCDFSMLKFRTMLPDRRVTALPYVGPERRRTHKSEDDPRHTPIGRFLRKTSIDELPQLLNVLQGHMSLVGPRPELASLVRQYAPWQRTRHLVKPGVTGLWQVTERAEGRLLHECIDVDLRYISGLSFLQDIWILVRTPYAVLRGKGVI